MRVHHFENEGVRSFDADPDKPIAEYIEVADDEHLFLVSDSGPELEPQTPIEQGAVEGILAVVVHRQGAIEVTVHYSGRQTAFSVSPGARIGAVRDQAIDQFGIDESDAADLGLRTMEGTEDLPVNEPIAKVAGRQHDRIDLQLVAMVHPQG